MRLYSALLLALCAALALAGDFYDVSDLPESDVLTVKRGHAHLHERIPPVSYDAFSLSKAAVRIIGRPFDGAARMRRSS